MSARRRPRVRLYILAGNAAQADCYRRHLKLAAAEAGYVASIDDIEPVGVNGGGELRVVGTGANRIDAHACIARAQACGLAVISGSAAGAST